ncbi:hypothetical protein C7120_07730 [Prevotella sp. oral taxon 376]|uniref:hypothetical protein n=1 Tax=Prevotella sp. oral taxon 376 TaxID=712466 RepID=UPI000D1F06B0|nr:hypothetical protein [Prevotella sp. oral taxon 376]PTL34405.1 hypothetical protein C7120_07730 [Prevotella sp. oral taxon 376]
MNILKGWRFHAFCMITLTFVARHDDNDFTESIAKETNMADGYIYGDAKSFDKLMKRIKKSPPEFRQIEIHSRTSTNSLLHYRRDCITWCIRFMRPKEKLVNPSDNAPSVIKINS